MKSQGRLASGILAVILLSVLIAIPAWATTSTIVVSQPTQITSNAYYERGECIIKASDGTFWLFYGRSTDFTGNYGTGNPDNSHYVIYYKTATTIDGLATAAPQAVPNMPTGTNKIYQGQTACAEYNGKIYVFATDMTNGGVGDIVYWTWDSTNGWSTEQDTGFDGHHLDVLAHGGKLWLSWNGGDRVKVASYDGTTWSTPTDIEQGNVSGPITRLYEDSSGQMILYFSNGWGKTPDIYYFYIYNDATSSWPATASATLQITEAAGIRDCDPLLTQVNGTGDYIFIWAPYDPSTQRQWLNSRTASTLAGLQSATTHWLTYGGYPGTSMVDMWPRAIADGSDVYMFYNAERTAGDETQRGTGNIWMLPLDWDMGLDHFDYIQPAIDEASSGDTILVHDGTYHEKVLIDESVTLQAASSPVIDGNDTLTNPAIHITAANVTVRSFIIQNFICEKAGDPSDTGAILVEGDGAKILDNIVKDITCTGSGDECPCGLGIDVHANNVEVIGNQVYDISSIGIRVRHDWDNPPTSPNNILIEDNEVYHTGNSCVLITGYAKGVTIKGNEIYESLQSDVPYNLFVHYGASDITIEDNHIHDAYANIVLAGCDNVTIADNIIEDATPLPSDASVKGKNIYCVF